VNDGVGSVCRRGCRDAVKGVPGLARLPDGEHQHGQLARDRDHHLALARLAAQRDLAVGPAPLRGVLAARTAHGLGTRGQQSPQEAAAGLADPAAGVGQAGLVTAWNQPQVGADVARVCEPRRLPDHGDKGQGRDRSHAVDLGQLGHDGKPGRFLLEQRVQLADRLCQASQHVPKSGASTSWISSGTASSCSCRSAASHGGMRPPASFTWERTSSTVAVRNRTCWSRTFSNAIVRRCSGART